MTGYVFIGHIEKPPRLTCLLLVCGFLPDEETLKESVLGIAVVLEPKKDCLKYEVHFQLNCYLDPRGASCRKMFIEMTEELPKPEPPMPEIPPIPIPMLDEEELDEVPPSQPPLRDVAPTSTATSTWERDDPRHISRRRDSASGGRRSEHSSRSGIVLP